MAEILKFPEEGICLASFGEIATRHPRHSAPPGQEEKLQLGTSIPSLSAWDPAWVTRKPKPSGSCRPIPGATSKEPEAARVLCVSSSLRGSGGERG